MSKSMNQYVIKRDPVQYTNGKISGVFYFQKEELGFANVTLKLEEAKRFRTKKDAEAMARKLGGRYYVRKLNWIEKKIGKEMIWSPCRIGWKHGREWYTIDWMDGTSGNYFIDFEEEEIEEA